MGATSLITCWPFTARAAILCSQMLDSVHSFLNRRSVPQCQALKGSKQAGTRRKAGKLGTCQIYWGLTASSLVQVGACIVGRENIILSIGYNGFPRRCHDTKLPWAKKSYKNDPLQTKYPFVCHAEMNAILNKNAASLHDSVCQRKPCKCHCSSAASKTQYLNNEHISLQMLANCSLSFQQRMPEVAPVLC